jgi:hypothetical protein
MFGERRRVSRFLSLSEGLSANILPEASIAQDLAQGLGSLGCGNFW